MIGVSSREYKRPASSLRVITSVVLPLAVILLSYSGCTKSQVPWEVRHLLVSPDGKYVAISADSDQGHLFSVFDTVDGSTIYEETTAAPLNPERWHADSRQLLVSTILAQTVEGDGIYLLQLPSGKKERAVPRIGVEVDPVWSPEYDEILFAGAVASPGGHIQRRGTFVCQVTGEETELLVEDLRPVQTVSTADDDYGVFCWQGVGIEEANSDGRTVASISLVDRSSGSSREIVSPQMKVRLACSVSPDGSQMALLRSHTDDATATELVLYNWQQDVKHAVAVQDRLLRGVWSPNGDRVLCIGKETLYCVRADELKVTEVPLAEWSAGSAGRAVDWAGHGEDVLAGLGDEVVRINVQTGERTPLVALR